MTSSQTVADASQHTSRKLKGLGSVNLALLLPMTGAWDVGLKIAGAAALAVERVNADEALLPGRTLEYSWADSGCSEKKGLAALGKLMGGEQKIDVVIGPACSAACEVTSHLAGGQDIPQISFSCTSPTLSDKSKYELFSRTVSPETSKGPALVALFGHYKWTKAVMLTSTDGVYFESGLKLTRQLKEAGIEVLKPPAFEPGRFSEDALGQIRRSRIRIVLVLAYQADQKAVLSSARRAGMSGAGWAWIAVEDLGSDEELVGWLTMRPLLLSEGMQAFAEQVSEYTGSHFNLSLGPDSVDLVHGVALHDAVLLYAHAATTMLSHADIHDGKAVTAAVRSTVFESAVSGRVALDRNGDRNQSYQVMNYVMVDGGVSTELVGSFDSNEGRYTANGRAVVWPGDSDVVPVDQVVHERRECEKGEFLSAATESCRPCAPGYFRSKRNSLDKCLDCADIKDHYQDKPGRPSCKKCPENTERLLNTNGVYRTRHDCRCIEGYWASDVNEPSECKACPEGGTCTGDLRMPFAQAGWWTVPINISR